MSLLISLRIDESVVLPYQPLHPGEHLSEYLDFNGYTPASFAFHIGVPPSEVANLLTRQGSLTPRYARLLGLATGMEAADWLEIQLMWDGWERRQSCAAGKFSA